MMAYTRAFEAGGRTFLLSADLTVVPADRVRAFRRSLFRGTELGRDVALPIGWFRTAEGRVHARSADGRIEPTGKSWPIRSYVMLGEPSVEQQGVRYWPVRSPGLTPAAGASGLPAGSQATGLESFADERELTVVSAEAARPFGVEEGAKWIAVSITAGTLVAYDDLRPVYATLISAGQGGVPVSGRDHVKYSTTPVGAFRITYKDRAATMSPETGEDRSFWIADVPFTQYFNPPFALHASYWHEQFGQPMSAGCINASPLDAEWLFGWTGPAVPDGWNGATGASAPENGRPSWVVVGR
jgi:hypothetical protein